MTDLFGKAEMCRSAVFSPCRQYRYELARRWDDTLPDCLFVMLNPSTADESADDPTSRRCLKFAADWGYGGVVQMNLYALRGSEPKVLRDHDDPVGPLTDEHLERAARSAGVVIAAWGTDPMVPKRDSVVAEILRSANSNVMCLRQTKERHPSHPLYLPKTLKPFPFIESARSAVGEGA